MDERYTSLPLNPLRAFAIASRHKTFTAAAEYMGISQVAISRQISILEGYLDLQLFERGARSVKLTENGRAFGQEISPLFDSLEAATRRLLLHERAHAITLRIYPTLAHYWLLPRLSRFREAYPDYEVRLDTVVEPLDFRGTHLDVAIQLGNGAWKDSKSTLLFKEKVDVVCSPAYADTIQAPGQDGAECPLTILHSKYRRRAWADWSNLSGVEVGAGTELEYESSLLTYSAAVNGMGLAIGQVDILRNELSSGALVTPFNAPQRTGSEFYVVWPTTKSVSTQTRRFMDWLVAECAETT